MSAIRRQRMSGAAPSFETVLFSAVALTAVLGIALRVPSPPVAVQIGVLGVLVAVLGLPHGALDPLVARRAGLWRTPLGFAGFNLGYLATVGLVVGVWLLAPVASLVAFLVVSGIHFGADWNPGRSVVVRSLTGLGLLTLPSFAHHDEVAAIYRTLAGPGGAVIADVQSRLGLAAIVAMLLGAVWAVRRRPTDALEIVIAGTLAIFAPPLVFFVLYFCALHSARHLRHGVDEERGNGRAAILITVVYTVVPILAVGILTVVFARDFAPGGSLDADWIIRLVFIGLAALTVPHMAVIALGDWRRWRGGRGTGPTAREGRRFAHGRAVAPREAQPLA